MVFRSRLIPNRTLTLKRRTNFGEYDTNGFQLDEEFESREIVGNLQPISGFERLQVDEGERNRALYWFYTQDSDVRQNDIIVDDTYSGSDIEYEVEWVEDWLQQRLSHLRARCVRRDV